MAGLHQCEPLRREVGLAKLEQQPVNGPLAERWGGEEALRTEKAEQDGVAVAKVIQGTLLVARRLGFDVPPTAVNEEVSHVPCVRLTSGISGERSESAACRG